jgi:spore cortex formation protein SpoVR/YcgB (stage V sporulation)
MKTFFSVEEVEKYLSSCLTIGEAIGNLSAENIIAANSDEERELEEDEVPFLTHHMVDDDKIKPYQSRNIQDYL